MKFLETAIFLCGLLCFPITMVIREWLVRPVWAIALLLAILGVVWGIFDSRPSPITRYGALGYAAVLVISACLYFTSRSRKRQPEYFRKGS
jgi:4-amino-4-deoxy-L-arabinose transferase-like glycosyltransferase